MFAMVAALFVMNFGLGVINEASDVEFYLGAIMTLGSLATILKIGHLFYLQFKSSNSGDDTPPEKES